jgi:hypothetical protein
MISRVFRAVCLPHMFWDIAIDLEKPVDSDCEGANEKSSVIQKARITLMSFLNFLQENPQLA